MSTPLRGALNATNGRRATALDRQLPLLVMSQPSFQPPRRRRVGLPSTPKR
jgi:hypothetical protein